MAGATTPLLALSGPVSPGRVRILPVQGLFGPRAGRGWSGTRSGGIARGRTNPRRGHRRRRFPRPVHDTPFPPWSGATLLSPPTSPSTSPATSPAVGVGHVSGRVAVEGDRAVLPVKRSGTCSPSAENCGMSGPPAKAMASSLGHRSGEEESLSGIGVDTRTISTWAAFPPIPRWPTSPANGPCGSPSPPPGG